MNIVLSIPVVRALYADAGSSHDFAHVLRVTALAERIAAAEGADLAIVRTAALLHDIAESEDRANHHMASAARARTLLRDCPAAFVDAVAHAIEAHRFRAGPAPATLEAQVVFDADKLDITGAIGVARAFAYAGEHGNELWNTPWRAIAAADGDARSAPVALGRAYTPGHEFVYKLDRIGERLYTATARAIAHERAAFMRAFFDRLDQEAIGAA
ncbi:MAG: HD domain-containing protein [Anaerolineae bacterium]|nr:HD domain-containing protein [Anaerolineae bacterium]